MASNWVPRGYSSTNRTPSNRFRTAFKMVLVGWALAAGAGMHMQRNFEDKPAKALAGACLDKTYSPSIKAAFGWAARKVMDAAEEPRPVRPPQTYYGFTAEEVGANEKPQAAICSPAEHKAMRNFQLAAAIGLIGIAGIGAGAMNYIRGDRFKSYRGPYPPGGR